jgi:Cytochrome c554 and c-prime
MPAGACRHTAAASSPGAAVMARVYHRGRRRAIAGAVLIQRRDWDSTPSLSRLKARALAGHTAGVGGARRWTLAVAVGLGVLAVVAVVGRPRVADQAPSEFRSAVVCRQCHQEIYDEWRASPMARSVELAGWSLEISRETLADGHRTDDVRALCYACHAPFARTSGPLDLRSSPHREGVSCDYCHSLREVEASPHINVARVEPGNVKTGPRADAKSPGHETLALPLMQTSEFCAGCHYFAWPGNGMPIDWTYAQWAASPYRTEGVQCQDCHMPKRPGRACSLPDAPDRGGVRSHRFLGARDLPTLRSALALRARREGEAAVIEVENVGAGHSIPGGGGELRRLELRLVRADGRATLGARSYQIEYFDDDGDPISGSDDGAVRFEDTTIRARETRVERLPLARDVPATVELWFWYVTEEIADRDGGEPEAVLVTSFALPAGGGPDTAAPGDAAPSGPNARAASQAPTASAADAPPGEPTPRAAGDLTPR